MFLTLLLAQVLEAERVEVADVVAHAARHADAAGGRQGLQPGGDVHAVAEDVAVLGDDVADIDADPERHAPMLGDRRIQPGYRLLHAERAADRVDHARELGQHAVAGGVRDPAAERHDQLVDGRPVRRERRQSRFLVERHQTAVAFDIGREDRHQPAIETWCFHEADPVQRCATPSMNVLVS